MNKAVETLIKGDEAAQIDDNAKRSVSIRINTSDYGRIKLLARQLRTRESEVFRFLLQTGLDSVAPLHDSARCSPDSLVSMLAALGPEAAHHFKLDNQRLRDWVTTVTAGTTLVIDPGDLELMQKMYVSADLVRMRLEALIGEDIPAGGVRRALTDYLVTKYAGP